MAKKREKGFSESVGLDSNLGLYDLSSELIQHFKPRIPEKELLRNSESLIHQMQLMQNKVDEYFRSISSVYYLSAFLTWIKDPRNSMDSKIRGLVRKLFEDSFIKFEDDDHNLLILEQVKSSDLTSTIDEIRCHPGLSISEKETLVELYSIFTFWLQTFTYGFIHAVEDPDVAKSTGRSLSLRQFYKFLEKLDQKGQLVAKLLYFGGSRTLDDVLSLKLENVNFKSYLIRYGTQLISYPRHVFADIKALTDPRKKGRVFVGRQATPLNPATIFRKFKEAGSLAGMGDSFSPKSLTTSS